MSAEFIVDAGPLKGLVLSLEGAEEWILGRDPEQCTLLLEDPEVDRVQLKCVLQGPDIYAIENLSTARAVLVNDVLLTQPHILAAGDRIGIGQTLLTFASKASSIEKVPETDNVVLVEETEEVVPHPLDEMFATTLEAPTEDVLEGFSIEPAAEEVEVPMPMPVFEPQEELHLDLTPSSRFLLKVIGGPNTGAEFALDAGSSYLIGTDTTTCDIIFHDLSVSREHARLTIGAEGNVVIEDLHSRNGVVVDQRKLTEPTSLYGQAIVTLGTSSFLLIDKEAPQETIATPFLEIPKEEIVRDKEEAPLPIPPPPVSQEQGPRWMIPPQLVGTVVLGCIVLGLAIVLGSGLIALSHAKEVVVEVSGKDLALQVQEMLSPFPGVRYTFNRASRQLFLVGHVTSAVENSELDYNLQSLSFLRGVQNNVVNDEAIWQEMNLLLSKYPEFKGISMHAPRPGVFIVSGYLKTEAQAANLVDYLNVNFNYLSLLENRVVVEEEVGEEVASRLVQKGYGAVLSGFLNGDLTLTGHIPFDQTHAFEEFVTELSQIPGVRHIQNYVVVMPEQTVQQHAEQQAIDFSNINLADRYPGRYIVTGYSKHGLLNLNVVINGKILMRGDSIDGMIITNIQPHTIFLEKDGLKYKLEYNK